MTLPDNQGRISPPATLSKEEIRARLADIESALPLAPEPVSVPIFRPGVICFRDNVLTAVSPSIDVMWPLIEDHIARLLEQLQPVQMVRHNLDYWRGRFETGCSLPLAFSNPEGTRISDAGLINCELDYDGKPMVGLMVYTLRGLDLQHAARFAEIVALKWGAERVKVWTPLKVPLIPGYEIEAAHYGQLQVAPVRPIQ